MEKSGAFWTGLTGFAGLVYLGLPQRGRGERKRMTWAFWQEITRGFLDRINGIYRIGLFRIAAKRKGRAKKDDLGFLAGSFLGAGKFQRGLFS
ncbi:MAG: hypothetical protein R3F11_12625 [Verrucomicrobiales bacterium]